jgi:hypothetical protein
MLWLALWHVNDSVAPRSIPCMNDKLRMQQAMPMP